MPRISRSVPAAQPGINLGARMLDTLDLPKAHHQDRAPAADWCSPSSQTTKAHPTAMTTIADVSSASPLAGGELDRLLAGLLPGVLGARGDLLAIKDLASGRWVHAHAPMADFLRRPLAELLGSTDAEIFEPALVPALRAAEHTALAQAAPLTSEHRVERAGARREFSVLRWATPADAPGRRFLCSVWTDLAPE